MTKKKGRNRHHLKPKSRGGQALDSNLLLIKLQRHVEWHKIFGNLTLDEIIELLIRVQRAKKHQEALDERQNFV